MRKKPISFSHFLYIVLLLYCSCSATNDSQSRSVISNLLLDDNSNMIMSHRMVNKLENDPICDLTEEKKMTLCKLIFDLPHFKYLDIHPSLVALSTSKQVCEEKQIRFETLSSEGARRKMFPCYGRHNPVRTSFVEDNYYDKFFLSGGPDVDSVVIFVREYDADFEWYRIYDYIKGIPLSELMATFIKLTDMEDELESNREIISTNEQREIEYVYIREKEYMPVPDPICDLEREKKISLCERIILGESVYKNFFWMTVNRAAFYTMDPKCVEKPLKIRYSERLKNVQLVQKMYPCFGRTVITFGNILRDNYLNYVYVSAGPRRNSVFVYLRRERNDEEEFYLFELYENVDSRDLKTVAIKYEDLVSESSIARRGFIRRRENPEEHETHETLGTVDTKPSTEKGAIEKQKKGEPIVDESEKETDGEVSNTSSSSSSGKSTKVEEARKRDIEKKENDLHGKERVETWEAGKKILFRKPIEEKEDEKR